MAGGEGSGLYCHAAVGFCFVLVILFPSGLSFDPSAAQMVFWHGTVWQTLS